MPEFPAARGRALLLAGAAATLAVQATPSLAATVEFLAGPLNLLTGQVAEVAIGDPNIFSCSAVGVQILAGTPGGRGAFATALVVNTFQDPEIVPAGRGLVEGFQDPNQMPGERRVLLARVQATCAASSAVMRTGLPVTFAIRDLASGRTEAVVPGAAR